MSIYAGPARVAIEALLEIAGAHCDNFTTGVLACARGGRHRRATQLGEQWCDRCIAADAIVRSFGDGAA